MAAPGAWQAIVLTSTSKQRNAAFLEEFQKRRAAGFVSKETVLLAVDDPQEGVGSGGATLNALLVVTEYLSAQAGHTVANPETLASAHILILHLGGAFACDPCGKAFTAFAATQANDEFEMVMCNADYLLDTITALRDGAPPGIWVCSTEMLLSLHARPTISWAAAAHGISVFAIPGDSSYAQEHGVYQINEQSGEVLDLVFRGTASEINACALASGKVPLVAGILRMCPETAERLISLHVHPPLDACTYHGADNGAEPIGVSLFLDIVKSMTKNASSAEEFAARATHSQSSSARIALWHGLHSLPVTAIVLENARHVYMPANFRQHSANLFATSPLREDGSGLAGLRRTWSQHTHFSSAHTSSTSKSATLINTFLEQGAEIGESAVMVHSHLCGAWKVGAKSLVVGVSAPSGSVCSIMPEMALYQHRARLGSDPSDVHNVWTLLGLDDCLVAPSSSSGKKLAPEDPIGTFCNRPWDLFFKATQIEPAELWEPGVARCAGTAKVFPVAFLGKPVRLEDMLWLQSEAPSAAAVKSWRSSWRVSLQDILAVSDLAAEFSWRRQMYDTVGVSLMSRALMTPEQATRAGARDAANSASDRPPQCFLPFFRECANEKRFRVFEALDAVAATTTSPGVAARTLACIADMLGVLADNKGGLRSGPGRNASFMRAFELLEEGNIAHGVRALAVERNKWLDTPESLIRAARHYEAAAQILIRHAVMTAREFIKLRVVNPLPMGTWVTVEASARIDLSGGWTDTPPITYEHGGAVVNAAIVIDGKHSMGARARRIPEFHIVLNMIGNPSHRIVIDHMDQLRNYTQPQAPGALLKAAFCCAEIINLDTSTNGSLREQLENVHKCGYELETYSYLPHGSGLGTSSILAGTVMAALWKAMGRDWREEGKDSSEDACSALNHAVLHLEQMMTTGGGWQDQVGGIVGGVKIARSEARLPLRVDVERLRLSLEFIAKFGEHLVLIYTGKTRLARNLLQNVLRNWYARDPRIVENADALTQNAEACAQAFQEQSLEKIGRCLSTYWAQKKLMAPGCEPALVRHMMDLLEPHAYGQALAGAGGGGFMYVISKEPNASAALEKLVRENIPDATDIQFHKVEIDSVGLHITYQS